MTTPIVAVSLCLLHASLVVLATLIARACLPSRAVAARATVGGVGMVCILVVTGLTFLPLPGVWPEMDVAPVESQVSPSQPITALRANQTDVVPGESRVDAKSVSNAEVGLSLDWLWRLGSSLQRVTVAAETSPRGWQRLLLVVLFGGAAISLVRLLLATRSVRRLRLTSSLIADESLGKTVDELKQRCCCRRRIELRETDQLSTAAVFGWWRPVVLLPADWRQWSAEELGAVLAHEVAHIHRGDCLQRLIALVGVAVHFYHPLVRTAARRLAVDQEFAADRLARGLGNDEQAYTRGLARLALRYHESLQDQRAWSSVSIMPRSSDFLARRLEMLRVKNVSIGKRTGRALAWGASACLVAVALATALLRGVTASEESTEKGSSRPVAETARLEAKTNTPDIPAKSAETDKELFRREPFDLSMLHYADKGAVLVRVGDILKHPEVQPHVDTLNHKEFGILSVWIKMLEGRFDLREIEWIASGLVAMTKPHKNSGGKNALMFGGGHVVIRMAHAADWQEITLETVSGSSLENFHGKNYIRLPVIPAFGPFPPCVRFPNDKTIIVCLGFKEDDAKAKEKALSAFFDDTSKSYEWAKTWRAVDGGLITLLFDNGELDWFNLDAPEMKKDWPESIAPLLTKTKYFAAGWDWTENSNRTGVLLRSACTDHESAREVDLAMTAVMNFCLDWYGENGDDVPVEYREKIGQFILSVRTLTAAQGGDHFFQVMADVGWEPQELIEIIRKASQ